MSLFIEKLLPFGFDINEEMLQKNENFVETKENYIEFVISELENPIRNIAIAVVHLLMIKFP